MKEYLGAAQSHMDLIEALDLWSRAFPATPREYFEYAFLYDPMVEYRNIRLLRVDGKLASSVLITPRKLHWEGKIVPFGGIANVSTHPEFTRRGLSTRVLSDSVATMKTDRLPLSMLFTDINPFYERVGFVTVPRQTFVADFGNRLRPDPAVRTFDLQRDFKAVQEIHDEFSSRWNGPMVRTEIYWQNHFRLPKQNTRHFLVRFEKGVPIAYLRGKEEKDRAVIMEFGALKNEAENLHALSQEFLIRANRQKVSLTAPFGVLFQEMSTLSVSTKPNTELMVSVLNPEFFGTNQMEVIFPADKFLYWETDSF